MKTALALLGVLLVSCLILFGLWVVLPAGEGGAASAELESGAALATEEATPPGAAPAALAASDKGQRTAEARAEEETEEATVEESWDARESVWVRGSVDTTGATCRRDDLLTVYALEREADGSDLRPILDPESPTGDGPAAEQLVLSRRPVDPDGSFELPLPPGTRRVHLVAFGRFLYMEGSRAFEVGGNTAIVLNPQCGGSIEGRVERPGRDGSAAAGDEIELVLSGKVQGALTRAVGYRRKTRAAADGSFAIHAIPSGKPYTLDADCAALGPERVEVELLTPGEARPLQILLGPGARVHGRVVDEAGVPVEGAKVTGTLKRMFSENLGERETETDSEGRFALAALSAGAVSFQAERDGYLASEDQVRELVAGEEQGGIELVLERGASISGTLRWSDGTPAADVKVVAKYDPAQVFARGGLNAQRGTNGEDRTDSEGRFEIGGLASSRFDLSADARPPEEVAARFFAALETKPSAPLTAADEDPERPSRIFDADWVAREQGVKSPGSGLELVLQPPRGIAGRVVDERDEPVTDFRVRAVQFSETPIGPMARDKEEKPFEDELGRFHFSGLVDGNWHLYALADGYSAGPPTKLSLPDQEDEEQVLRVLRSASVSGTVHSPLGSPVSSATVGVETGSPFWATAMSGAPDLPTSLSSGDGKFLLEGLAPGNVTLSVRAEGYAGGTSEQLELAPGQHVDGLSLYLSEGGTITGEVYGRDGEKATGRKIQAIRLKDMAVHFTDTDADGKFRVENVDAGSWQVQALPGEQRLATMDGADEEALGDLIAEMKTAVVEVEEGETVHVELGAPPADPIDVRGRVTHDGDPYGKVMVAFYREGKEMLQRMRSATTDAAGTFSLTLDGPGKYVATVQKYGGEFSQQSVIEFQVEIPDVEEHELELFIPTGRISGRLRAEGGGEIPNERVNLYPAEPASSGSLWGGQYFEVRSDEEGVYDIQGLRPGRYSVAVGGMAAGGMFGSAAEFGRVVREVEVDEEEWVQNVDFRLERAALARVSVVDAAGKAVSDAAIFVRDEAGRIVELFSMTSTDSQGVCEYGGLAPGRYTFSARKEGFASPETGLVRVGGGEATEVRLVLEEGTMLWVKLLNADGEGVEASISVLDEDGREVGTMIALSEIMEILGGEGFSMSERRIGPLPPGNYRVSATTKDGRQESKPVHLRRQSERRLTFHFRD